MYIKCYTFKLQQTDKFIQDVVSILLGLGLL